MAKGCKICQYLRLVISGALLGCIVWAIVLHFAYRIEVAIWLWGLLGASVILTIWSIWGFKRSALKSDLKTEFKSDFNSGAN